jgi:hypothetical protein
MAAQPMSSEITDTELIRLAREVSETGRPRLLRHAGTDLAVLMPLTASQKRRTRAPRLDADSRAVRRSLAIVARTAGAARRYAKRPPLSAGEERALAEQAIADELMDRMRA